MAASIALITPVVSCYSSHNSLLSSSFQRSPLRICVPSTTKAATRRRRRSSSVRALTLDLSGGSFFERRSRGGGDGVEEEEEEDLSGIGLGLGGDGPSAAAATAASEDKEEPQCPPGLRQYETMAVLRPDMTEDERLSLTQRYEELLVAGGGMYVEVFNRGVIPLAYAIKKKNKAGETNNYLDGIYLLFTYLPSLNPWVF
ncbi:putative 30S ribosomal protein S6 alpha, chloroplastic [Iris pallida]|uniref:30S ribosomal protein S6 alpha, chloroplastic n=1 Tax=Iris pallida TaxID=29817 RepID=A0AAX6FNQ8_IRIPA|nr:putative 30S ribosomal protein S6 alpha, chloroplastic [Iris pallida]